MGDTSQPSMNLMREQVEDMRPRAGNVCSLILDPGQWHVHCGIQKLTQTESDPYGCGVACLAMVSGMSFAEARSQFINIGLGVRRSHRVAFSTSSRELRMAIASVGLLSDAKRWNGWDQFHGLGVLKVRDDWRGAFNKWHWVVAFRHPTLGLAIFDPHMAIPAFKDLLLDDTYLPFSM